MKYREYTSELLEQLGVSPTLKGCEYIMDSIEFIQGLDKYTVPDSELVNNEVANKYVIEPVSVENSMRNAIQLIWTEKKNPELMRTIFKDYNMGIRPCNMEFIMLLFFYIQCYIDYPQRLKEAAMAAETEATADEDDIAKDDIEKNDIE